MREMTVEFEGSVLEIDGDEFTARIIDLRDGDESVATFKLTELSEADRASLCPGHVFRWHIVSLSEIRFDRRVWTKEEIEEAERRAKELANLWAPFES